MANVRFLSVKLRSTFDALVTKESSSLYWIEETQELYRGEKLYGTGALASEKAAGLLSSEDYIKLQELIASGGGLNGLKAIDGTISILNAVDGGKLIGVAIAPDATNALKAVDGGLFVPTVVVPEYSIEKQTIAEEGFAATYRLKKMLGEETSYIGDAINIARDLVLKSATLEIVIEDGAPYAEAKVGDPYIVMEFNDVNASALYIPVKGLVDVYTAGSGIEIIDNKISVKLADTTHGLVAIDGALAINLATRKSDGAMSKEDKLIIDSIPYAYVARKFDISGTPEGTLVNYGEQEIRIMVPETAEFKKQTVGVGGDKNTYYMTLKTYGPKGAVGYKEHLGTQSDAEILTDLKTDEYGRKYQPTWLGVAKFDEANGTWSYYGANSELNKFIGWDYRIDWYDVNNMKIASDPIRINLSNESCHYDNKPYYMANVATSAEVAEIKESVEKVSDSYTWADL